MTTSTPTPPGLAPRRPALTHRNAMALATTEYQRMADVLAALGEDDWPLPTACPDWNVRQLAAHMVGMAALAASPFESSRQQKLAAREHVVRAARWSTRSPPSRSQNERTGVPMTSFAKHTGSLPGRRAGAG